MSDKKQISASAEQLRESVPLVYCVDGPVDGKQVSFIGPSMRFAEAPEPLTVLPGDLYPMGAYQPKQHHFYEFDYSDSRYHYKGTE